jgi:hypothetical protein
MDHKPRRPLEERVVEAADGALTGQGYVSVIDVLTRIGYLAPVHVDGWRKGRVACLEDWIFVHPNNVAKAMSLFQEWARNRKLNPSETAYLARTTGSRRDLQFSKSGDPAVELAYRTHYVSPALPEKKQEKLRGKLSQAPELMVFDI